MNQEAYERDFYAWTMANAELLRRGKLSIIDARHIAEELESMGKSERRQLINRLAILIAHLLKGRHQPECRSISWRNTIEGQREDIAELLEDSPSLLADMGTKIARAYQKARRFAAADTGLDRGVFPENRPYSFEQIMDLSFWPE
jgi:hypothetical protein